MTSSRPTARLGTGISRPSMRSGLTAPARTPRFQIGRKPGASSHRPGATLLRTSADCIMGQVSGSSCTGSPFVTFVIDRSAETDALPQTVHLPAGVEPATLVATPLVSLTEDGHPALDVSVILLLPIDDSIEIRLRDPATSTGARPLPLGGLRAESRRSRTESLDQLRESAAAAGDCHRAGRVHLTRASAGAR